MGKILIVDDEPAMLHMLRTLLADRGHQTVTAASGREAAGLLDGVDAVFTDLQMPAMDGLELVRQIRERDATLPVVLMTAHGSERIAVSAIKAGAYDYLTKPFDLEEIALLAERALEARRLRVDNRRLVAEQTLGRRMIAESAPMRRLLDAVERLAEKDVTVLLRGETGTGKELIASLLHARSRRARRPLVRFNSAAIPGELAEAELFGHARGAFTGAAEARRGYFSEADGGTLVLDEVGELPAAVQAKLLRALQDGEIQPLGGRVAKVDVRVIASTNRDLAAMARAGNFREDLYYRLAVVELVVPPLRERREDIPALAEELARQHAEKFGVPDVRLSPALLARLCAADWPGNVRQLENTVARMVAFAPGGVIDVDALEPAPADAAAVAPSLREQVESFERSLIVRALSASGGNQSEAARRLGTSRGTLVDKLRKYGMIGATSQRLLTRPSDPGSAGAPSPGSR